MKATHLIYSLACLAALANTNQIAGGLAQQASLGQERAAFNDSLQQTKAAARQTERQAAEDSKLALSRVTGDCIATVDTETKQPTYLYEGRSFLAENGESPQGRVIICSATGDTAEALDGIIQPGSVARVSAQDLSNYQSLFALKGGN